MIDAMISIVPESWVMHAPALVVVIPMLAGPFCAFLPNGRLAWIVSILATGASTLMALVLLRQVQALPDGGVISYAMGGWAPPAGIEFRIDALNRVVILHDSAMGFLSSIFAWPTENAEIRRAAETGIYDIRGGGAKRRVPHFDDLQFLGA